MKSKYSMALLMLGMSVAAMAQDDDDMYFNSKDRKKQFQETEQITARVNQQEDINAVRTNPVNPSDSYSGRGVNPEYTAQGKNGTSVIQNEPDYFVSNYQPTNVNGNLYNGGSTGYSNYYGNSGFNNSYYNNMGYGGFGSPYGYGYSPYSSMYGGMGMYSPYSSMGYGMGMYSPYSMYGMGMGSYMGMGLGLGFGSYYGGLGYGGYGYNPFGYGYGGYGYGSNIIIVNGADNGTRTVTGRYGNRASSVNNNNYVSTGRATGVTSNGTASTSGRGTSNGRVAGGSTGSSNYYDRSWRNNSTTTGNVSRGSFDSNNAGRTNSSSWGGNRAGSSSWGSGSRSSGWDNSGSRSMGSGNSGFSGGNSGFSGGSRGSFGGGSSGGGSSSGGGGGSRGRH